MSLSNATTLANSTLSSTLNIHDTTDTNYVETLQSPFPYYFPEFSKDSADWFPMPDCNGVVLEEATIDELQSAMEQGQLTSIAIVMCYLQRIYQTDEYIK